MKAIFNTLSGEIAGYTSDPDFSPSSGFAAAVLPDGWDESDRDYAMLVDGAIVVDPVRKLDQVKQARKARIKAEAARLIEATSWKLERARERADAGWATLAEVDAVLAEREAIRRSSNAAEAAVDALTDVAAVQTFSWSIDVAVAAPRRLTHKQFSDRFTDAEMQAILAAAEANEALKVWWEKFKLARDINLDDPATQGGVHALEIAGLIGEGRAAEVLS